MPPSSMRNAATVLTLVIVGAVVLSACRSPHHEYASNVHVCQYDGRMMYVTVYGCPDSPPERDYIHPTSRGLGGGFVLFADTTGEVVTFQSIVGDYSIDNTSGRFRFEDLSPLHRAEQEQAIDLQVAIPMSFSNARRQHAREEQWRQRAR